MRVLMFISKIEPSSSGVLVGGSVNALLNLCKALAGEVEVSVVCGSRENVRESVAGFFPKETSVEIIPCSSPAQSARYGAEFILKLIGWLFRNRKKQYQVVHGHSGYGIYAWVTLLLARFFRASAVHTLYCPLISKGRVLGRKSLVLGRGLSSAGLRRLDAVVAMTGNIETSLVDAGLANTRVGVLPTAIDVARFESPTDRCALLRRIGVPEHHRFVLFVGNLTESKGIWHLLTAFRNLAAHVEDVSLVVTLELSHAGFNEAEARLETLLDEYGIRSRVRRLGFVPFMDELVASADGLVVPYADTQGPSDYPLIMMEAMAATTPIVGTSVGGIPELMRGGEHGLLVPPADSDALSSALRGLLEESEAAVTMAEKAKAYIVEEFGFETVRKAHLELYKKVL